MPLAPQRSNPGTRGQNVRYDLRGFQQIGPDRYTDGVYTYSGDIDNALSDNRPDTVVSGLFGADDDRSRDPQWRPGQPMPNQAAPRLIGQATQLAQRRRGASSAPLTGSPAYRRAAGDVNPAVAGAANALIEALIGKAERSTREINTRTGAIAGSLSGYGDKASGYYDDALRGSRGVGDAVAAAIRGTGQALQGDIAGKLAGIQAPGAAVDLQAGGQARTGDTAAAAAGGMSSAELERLKGTGDASAAMMGALPRIANLAGDQQRRGVLNQIGGELTDKLAELYGKQPGMILDAIKANDASAARAAEFKYKQQKDAADRKLKKQQAAALNAYRRANTALAAGRLEESKRYHDIAADLAAGRLDVSQYQALTARINAQTSQARLAETQAARAQRWQQHLDSLGIKGANLKLAQQREARLALGKKKGGFSATAIQNMTADSYDSAQDAKNGVFNEDSGEWELPPWDQPGGKRPQDVLKDLIGRGIPFSIAVKAVQRTWPQMTKTWAFPKAPAAPSGGSQAAGIRGILEQAGFSGEGLRTAMAVMLAESGGNPRAYNPRGLDQSYGLFQINMLGNLGPDRRRRFGLASNENLYDPLTNARVAYRMSKGGTDWSPWTTYTSGKYRQYLGQQDMSAPAGASAGVRELFYDPLGAFDEGNWIAPIGGHADHVHVSVGDVPTAVRAISLAQSLGLRVSENPYVDKVDPVHTEGSYHYRVIGTHQGRPVGGAIDVSGDPSRMAEFFRRVRKWV